MRLRLYRRGGQYCTAHSSYTTFCQWCSPDWTTQDQDLDLQDQDFNIWVSRPRLKPWELHPGRCIWHSFHNKINISWELWAEWVCHTKEQCLKNCAHWHFRSDSSNVHTFQIQNSTVSTSQNCQVLIQNFQVSKYFTTWHMKFKYCVDRTSWSSLASWLIE